MRRSLSTWFIGLCVAPVLLASSPALAGPNAAACNLITSGDCKLITPTGSCISACTSPNLVADCDGQCSASAAASCAGTCATSCVAQCSANPGSFSCASACETDCAAQCPAVCSGQGANCATICMADCDNRCGVGCQSVPPSADCATQCQVSCNGSCQVQANVACQASCVTNVAPDQCDVDCMAPTGALYCGGQYVDVGTAGSDCVTYLQSQGIVCVVVGQAYLEGAANPGTPCQVCAPATSTTGFSPAPDGTACPGGACQTGTCSPLDGGASSSGGATSTSSGGATSTSSGGGGHACAPGQQVACACLGGTMGVQQCSADASSFGPCECPDGGAGAGGSASGPAPASHGTCACHVAGGVGGSGLLAAALASLVLALRRRDHQWRPGKAAPPR